MIRAAWSSVAVITLAPMQDILDLGNEARMNYPGNPSGNWTWRLHGHEFTNELSARIGEMNYLFSRFNTEQTKPKRV
jgi:4-alpha-glucanotransferase